MKKKKKEIKFYAFVAGIALFMAVGVGMVVKAVNDNITINVGDGGVGIDQRAVVEDAGEELLGVGVQYIEDYFPFVKYNEGIKTAYDIQTEASILASTSIATAAGTFSGTVTAEQLTSTDDISVNDLIVQNGVQGKWTKGEFADATTTAFSVANPWSAPALVDVLLLDYQNGTTTVNITCGTTTTASINSDPSDVLIDDWEVATSTLGTATTTGLNKNGLAGGARSDSSGFGAPGTNSEDIIYLGADERIACHIEEVGAAACCQGGITSGNNIASGTYMIHSRLRY